MARGKKTGGGTRKGAPNKVHARTREDLWAYIDQKCVEGYNANPFHVLIDEMCLTTDRRLAVQCAAEMADRLLPKLKAVEHDLTDELKKVVVHRYGDSNRTRD
jgi:hypothetical protein